LPKEVPAGYFNLAATSAGIGAPPDAVCRRFNGGLTGGKVLAYGKLRGWLRSRLSGAVLTFCQNRGSGLPAAK